jgi:predicted Zn-dependent peptidase
MRLGNITEEEISDAKANLVTAYKSLNDKQSSIINLYMAQRFLGIDEDIDTMISKIKAVTKEDVVNVANKLEMEITYFLTNN